MAARKCDDARDLSRRVRHLVTLEAVALVARLKRRGEDAVALFSRRRERGPLIEATQTRLQQLPFAELSALEPAEQKAVAVFCEAIERCHWYVSYTEDMPLLVKSTLGHFTTELENRLHALTQVLGEPADDGEPVTHGKRKSGKRRKTAPAFRE